ncbi:hypothetical protein NKH36_03055 [Mesorhizobium sp. M1312]
MTAIENTHARTDEPDQYDVKVPKKLADTATAEKIVSALRRWSKRNDRAA